MAKSDVEQDFPALIGKDYDLSNEDFKNNCLGFALGDLNNWWEPPMGKGQYWSPGFAEDTTVETVEAIIRVHGFTIEVSKKDYPETEAIATFAIGVDTFCQILWRHMEEQAG